MSTSLPCTISAATAAHRDALVELIAGLNTRPEHQCLHVDTEAEGIATEVERMLAHPDIPLLIAADSTGLVGAIGAELSDEADKCWLRGPFLRTDDDRTLAALYEAMTAALPPSVGDLLAFPHADNTRLRSLYTGRGFSDTQHTHIYVAPRPDRVPSADPGVHSYSPDLFAQIDALHELAFPGTVENTADITAGLGESKQLFVLTDSAGTLEGYIAVSLNDAPVEGYVDFFAVAPASRGRGIGERLLRHALHWFFAVHAMPQAGLCVRDDRANARRLYERTGFSLLASGVGMRKRSGYNSSAEQ